MNSSSSSANSSSISYCGICSRDLDNEILNDGEFMIQCDVCEIWYHGKCVELEEFEAADIDLYHCPSCISQAGPSRPKRICNTHRYDSSDPDGANKPMENGTIKFVEELKKRKFRNADAVVVMKDGHSLTSTYLDQTKFQSPVVVENPIGLGMRLPPADFTVEDVERHVGGDRYVDVVDVHTQHSYKMRLRTFLDFFRQSQRKKLFNLISLEFSDTELSKLVKLPTVVDEMSWVEQYWPKPLRDDLSISQKAILNEHITVRPEVSKFCLIGMGESYTDFHIDFGGTSVFYHILWGEKVFYLIEPSEKNIRLFEEWQQTIGYSERFFGDIVDNCTKLVLKPGQTFFIPTGWIHAVYTPKDSLVIGGNFLHSFNIGMQIRIYEMEKRVSTAEKFMFPHFELTNWYAGAHFLDMMKELNEEKSPAKPYLLEGLKSLVTAMKLWVQRNQANMRRSNISGQIIIETMTCSQVLKQLERAVQVNEKFVLSSGSTKLKIKKKPEPTLKVNETPKSTTISTATPSISSFMASAPVITPIKVSVSSLKVSPKNALEKPKGCPKSPAKTQKQTDGIVNAVASTSKSNSIVGEVKKVKIKAEEPTKLKIKVDGGGTKTKDKEKPKEKSKSIAPKKRPKDVSKSVQSTSSSTTITRPTDSNATTSHHRPDLDSAPPTPKWSDDTDESVDKTINDGPTIMETTAAPPTAKTDEVQAREDGGDREIKMDEETTPITKNGDSEKKVFGFSLLDIQADPISSPPTSPPIKPKDPMMMHSPPAQSTTSAAIGQSATTKEVKNIGEKSSLPPPQPQPAHSTSMHGRVQKPSQRLLGKMPSSKTEYFPNLGYCRQDDEFVYPSLSDSELGESAPKKRKKPEKEKSPTKDPSKSKMQMSEKKSGESKPKASEGKANNKPSVSSEGPKNSPSASASTKISSTNTTSSTKKIPKGTTKQRLANKLKIRKIIPM